MDETQKAVYQGRLASIKEADPKADLRDELYWPLNSSRFGWESSAIDVWIEDSFWELLDLPQPLAAPSMLEAVSGIENAPHLKALATKVNLTKLFATLDVSQVFQTDNRNLKRYNAIYLNSWTYSPEYIEALREVLNKACRKAHGFSTHTIYIDDTLIGETEGYDDSELTRSYLCEQIQELGRLSIKYSGLV